MRDQKEKSWQFLRMCFSKMLLLQQTQIAALTVLTVPKACEINEKKSKRRTDRYTHTMFVIIYRMVKNINISPILTILKVHLTSFLASFIVTTPISKNNEHLEPTNYAHTTSHVEAHF